MKYRFLALLAVLMLVAAACGSDSEDTTTTAAAGGGDTETTAAATDAGEVIDIDFWVAFSDEARLGFAEDAAAAFNANHADYNIKVTSFASYNDAFDAAVLAVDSGEPPAMIHFFEAATRQALDAVDGSGNAIFKSVTDAIAGRTEILGEPVVLDSVVSAARDYYTVDGSFYSMPWNTSTTVMFNNMELLNAAGITEPPATWGDVETACEAVMALPDAPSGCITWPNHSWFVEQSLGQQGELLGNADNGRTGRATEVFLESDGMLSYLEWWKGLSDSGYYTYTGLQRDWDGTSNAYLAGEVAMLVYSSSDTTFFDENATFENQASFMPANDDVPYVGNLIGGATIWMLDGMDTVTEDGALAFMNFFSNPANAAAWHQLTGYVPITEDAVQLLVDEGWYEESPNSKVASDQLAAAQNTPASLGALLGNFVGIRDVITLAIEDILVNDLDVATRMAQANEEANKSLSEYELLFGN
ncbi:MAG: extracellular solute-binding protein [Acidimicrobiia bacterium]|nr:extracellular solute-binding protein [Acidimicrobiia bacterium]MDX2467525.1 extracellular solute-binding protein [Acidimicrobiia bacterium]